MVRLVGVHPVHGPVVPLASFVLVILLPVGHRQEEPTIGLDTRREETAMVQSKQVHCQHFI
jgi:hypothetical protein